MIYLFIGENRIKLLALSKTLLGQYNASLFDKVHSSDLLEKGGVKNTDVLASAVKEALTTAQPQEVKENEVCLILPQSAFTFARYEVPADIQSSAIVPFIRDKARADFSFDLDNTHSDFLVIQQEEQSTVLLYILQDGVFQKYNEVFRLLGLTIHSIVPDSVSYYKLFEKTLKKDKKENILYVTYEEGESWGYHYDSLGLMSEKVIPFGEKLEEELKKEAEKHEKKGAKIDRIILTGEKSGSVRQDLFTKEVGVWTNPLDKIVANFYADYLKLIVSDSKTPFPALKFDVCLGAFILSRENQDFSVYKRGGMPSAQSKGFSLPHIPINARDVVIFILSMLVTAGAIFAFNKFQLKPPSFSFLQKNSQSKTPTKKPEPTEKPTPTPSFTKESIRIKVLNGTGTVGQAGDMLNLLKEKGYVEVLTGNAENYDFTETEIRVKKDKKAAADMVRQDIADEIEVSKDNVSIIEDDEETADVIVVTGADFEG